MNLYFFNQSSKGAVFGVGSYISELTVSLRNSPANICVVHLMSDKPQIQKEVIEGVRYWYFPAPVKEQRTTDIQKQIELYLRNIVYLLQLHITDKKDLIFQFNYMNNKPLVDALRSAFDCKIISVVHYFDSCLSLSGNISRLRRIILQPGEPTDKVEKAAKVYFQKEKELLHSMDKIICLSNHSSDLLHQDYRIEKEKMVIICNGLTDRKSIQDEKDKQALRRKYYIPDIPIILFVGRLDNSKGIGYLIKAFHGVLEKFPDCRLMIAGNGHYDTYLHEAKDICTKVTFFGFLDKQELRELYQIADIGVTPSFFETFGYVAVEMMMYGLPIVATATSGLNEVVDDSCGLKIPIIAYPDKVEIDANVLAEKILYLLQNPTEARRLGKNARERYLKNYSSDTFGKNMIDFYKSLG